MRVGLLLCSVQVCANSVIIDLYDCHSVKEAGGSVVVWTRKGTEPGLSQVPEQTCWRDWQVAQ